MTKTAAAVQTLAEINPDIILEVSTAFSMTNSVISEGCGDCTCLVTCPAH